MVAIPEGQDASVALPLKHTRVQAEIAGLVSTVVVTQEFENPHATPIEAVYVFPLPQHAAVYGMKMVIGDRVIEGVIKTRSEARELYEQAKHQGRTASLLDQERPNIFTQSVANILPGDNILVELSYFHDLDYEKGRVEFVFPTVVGPRYIPGPSSGRTGNGWSDDTQRVPDASRISPPLLPPGVRSGHEIEIEVQMDTGVPFRNLETPSHAIHVDRHGPSQATVRLAAGDRIPNKDFVLRWRTNPEGPVAGWVTHHDHLGGYFLLILEPEAQIERAETAPREYVFVVDTSGSMNGFPLDQCKRLLERCLNDLDEEDNFQVILFAGSASTFDRAPVPATSANIHRAMEYVKGARGGGGTEFLPALEKALKHPADPERSRIVLFLSDGYIGYEAEVLKYMNEHLGSANLFPMGIGTSVNRYLIDAMARIGKGKPFYLRPDENPEETVHEFFQYVSRPSVTGIEADFEDLPVYELWPEKIPDLFAGRPVTLVGRFDEGAEGRVTLTGWFAGKRWRQTLSVELPDDEPANPGLPLLWARKRIEELSDDLAIGELDETEAKDAITELGIQYSLMSAYTSFVAIDSQVRNPGGEGQTVSVPLPLPDQVSPLAAPGHAYVTGNSAQYKARESLGGFLCRKQAPSSPGISRDAITLTPGSLADTESPAELEEEPRKKEDAGIRIRKIQVRGTLAEEAVRRVLDKVLKEWSRDTDLSPIQGTLVLALTVEADGKVAQAWVQNKEAFKEEALRVILERARGLAFPKTEVRSHIHVTMSFPR
jgi:Ca-activated chloride channel family protein